MRKYFLLLGLFISSLSIFAQELYVSTEPASNMPKDGVALRLSHEGSFQNSQKRIIPEVMLGLDKNLMVHASAYLSNFYQSKTQLNGWSTYAKYRFLSNDSTNWHFRGAAYAKYASFNNPVTYQEINLEGNNSGVQVGVVFTQLLHKLALSGSVNYTKALNNRSGNLFPDNLADESIGYTFSSGLLVYPKLYRNYKQTNINLYLEFLGKSNIGTNQHLMDAAPAVQFILNSNLRIDLSQRIQLWNNMSRAGKNMFLVRLEYNLFNVL
ncbi:MAG: hypothetical protein ACKOW2_09355 [Sphingobacteriaceae bacterium]